MNACIRTLNQDTWHLVLAPSLHSEHYNPGVLRGGGGGGGREGMGEGMGGGDGGGDGEGGDEGGWGGGGGSVAQGGILCVNWTCAALCLSQSVPLPYNKAIPI